MAKHAAHAPQRIAPKPKEQGAAHTAVHHERRHRTTEGRTGFIGAGADLGGTTWNSDPSGPAPFTYPGVLLDTTGLKAYNAGGVITAQLDANTGNFTVNGAGVITGGTIQTAAVPPRVIFDGTGIRGYNPAGIQTFGIDTSGNLTVGPAGAHTITGTTIQTAAANPRVILDGAGIHAYNATAGLTVNVGSDGTFFLNTPLASLTVQGVGFTVSSGPSTATGARVTIDATGIKGFDALNNQKFILDAASGLIQATGLINANPGSTMPWQTTGFFIGGGNLLGNSSAEDPTTSKQILYVDSGQLQTNLLTDPSLEGDTPGAAPAWWTLYNPGSSTVSTFAVQTGWAQDGTKSLRITVSSLNAAGPVGVQSPNIPVTAGTTYQFIATMNLLSQGVAPVTLQLNLQFYNSSGGLLVSAGGIGYTGLGVHNVVTSWTAPAGAVNVRVSAYVYTSSSTAADFYVDALMLSVGTTTPSYVGNSFFTLQWNPLTSTTPTAQIPTNATASQVQAALSATNVLPQGISVSCTGGPLPATITMTILGINIPPPVIFISSQVTSGGNLVLGPLPTIWVPSFGTVDVINYSQAFHGGKVLRLTSNDASGQCSIYQSLGAIAWTPGVTRYTFSAYFRSPVISRNTRIVVYWFDLNNNPIRSDQVASSWVTNSTSWQRLVGTFTVPPATMSQEIDMSASVTGGTFQLTLGAYTTTALAWNSTAAQVRAALEALPNVGSGGTQGVQGGPFPNLVRVQFFNDPGVTMAVLTGGLTGGTGTLMTTINVAPYSLWFYPTIGATSRGEVHYVDAAQIEVGDVVSAYAPRGDEILADTVQANMINVAVLSGITANLGTITAGTINAVSINTSVVTGSVVQTSISYYPRIVFDSSGFRVYNSAGGNTMNISSVDGSVTVTGGSITGATIIGGSFQTSATNPLLQINASNIIMNGQPSGPATLAWVYSSGGYMTGEIYGQAGWNPGQGLVVMGGSGGSVCQMNMGEATSSGNYINFYVGGVGIWGIRSDGYSDFARCGLGSGGTSGNLSPVATTGAVLGLTSCGIRMKSAPGSTQALFIMCCLTCYTDVAGTKMAIRVDLNGDGYPYYPGEIYFNIANNHTQVVGVFSLAAGPGYYTITIGMCTTGGSGRVITDGNDVIYVSAWEIP